MSGEALLAALGKVVLVVAIGLPLIVYLAQDGLIFYRQGIPEARRAEIARRHADVADVFLTAADGTRTHAWHLKAGPPLVLYFGGNAEEVSWMIEAAKLEAPGVSWLFVDYRGYGQSEGSPSEKALLGDALALYDHAVTLPGVDAKSIYAFGRSLGSGVAVALAAERPLAGVVLVAPYDSLAALAKRYYWYLPVDWMLRHRFDSIARAPRVQAPLLCIAAADDEVIPREHSERLYDAWGGPKRKVTLAGASHNAMDHAPRFWPSIREFLENRGQSPISR